MLLGLHRDGVPKDVLLATQYYRFRSTPKDITGESHEAASLPGRGAARTGERKRGSRLADLDPSDAQCGHQRSEPRSSRWRRRQPSTSPSSASTRTRPRASGPGARGHHGPSGAWGPGPVPPGPETVRCPKRPKTVKIQNPKFKKQCKNGSGQKKQSAIRQGNTVLQSP